jgi:hypothetical protein
MKFGNNFTFDFWQHVFFAKFREICFAKFCLIIATKFREVSFDFV